MTRFLILSALLFSLISAAQPAGSPVFLGRTTGNLPYLEYGLGTDRLGGAKMSLLDTGVLLRVVDSTVINYKVQLAAAHFAYLPKTQLRRDTITRWQPYYLTSSWLVNGNDSFDLVTVTLDERLPYRSQQLIHPSRLVVDIFGATSNTNWITQRSTALGIRNVYHEQIEDDVFRVVIELQQAQHWGYRIFYRGNRLVIRLRRPPAQQEIRFLKVAVDAGHGGSNNGARGGKTGIQEKEYTLRIARELENVLQRAGARVFMTRRTDTTLDMVDRIRMLEREQPDFLISIHLNSAGRDSVRGVSTYYRHLGFRPLSQYVQKSMLALGLEDFGNVGSFNFALSGPTDYPNCLVEVAFLSNPEDEKLILDPEFHKAVATQILCGIEAWLEACRRDQPYSGGNGSPR